MAAKRDSIRYGVGEIYGRDAVSLSSEELRRPASANHKKTSCPFKPRTEKDRLPKCSKKGGVCSLREYTKSSSGKVEVKGAPITTCPYRFLEDRLIFKWVGETLLGTSNPSVISELPFLMSQSGDDNDGGPVGMIDKVLVKPESRPLAWCALEMQAVYFSGRKMEDDFKAMRRAGTGPLFPAGQRHPDFRSSGPKRLMPQLQIKVPTISRWGKKMAVIIDKAFWESLSEMREVQDVSNSEIAWFVVSYAPTTAGHFVLRRHEVHFTTLSHAVEGLTGGTPMSLERFEREIHARLSHSGATRDLFQ